jgi:hypothetical protein
MRSVQQSFRFRDCRFACILIPCIVCFSRSRTEHSVGSCKHAGRVLQLVPTGWEPRRDSASRPTRSSAPPQRSQAELGSECGLEMMWKPIAMRREMARAEGREKEARAEKQRRRDGQAQRKNEHCSMFPVRFSSSLLLCAFASLREISRSHWFPSSAWEPGRDAPLPDRREAARRRSVALVPKLCLGTPSGTPLPDRREAALSGSVPKRSLGTSATD